jgi:hypothetical protein
MHALNCNAETEIRLKKNVVAIDYSEQFAAACSFNEDSKCLAKCMLLRENSQRSKPETSKFASVREIGSHQKRSKRLTGLLRCFD